MAKIRKKRNLTAYVWIAGLTVSLASLVLVAFHWIDRTQLLRLEQIAISGNSILTDREISELLGDLSGSILPELNLSELTVQLEAHPYVAAARLSVGYPHLLKVEIIERQPLVMVNQAELFLLDREGVCLPMIPQAFEYQIPALSGFNPDRDLYPLGRPAVSVKMKETIRLLRNVHDNYPALFRELSEVTLSQDDEYMLILTNRPTRINLGKASIMRKIATLMAFDQALQGRKALTDYNYLDLRFSKQIIAREWS
ncbi:MAG: FtsQ-type POTRA domain-containing protein [Candidatus Neomarinimicrobiota bacterium]